VLSTTAAVIAICLLALLETLFLAPRRKAVPAA